MYTSVSNSIPWPERNRYSALVSQRVGNRSLQMNELVAFHLSSKKGKFLSNEGRRSINYVLNGSPGTFFDS